ncbi:hypothetical protein D3C81_1680350 [compost metagenome]
MLVSRIGRRAVRQRIPFGSIRNIGHAAFESDFPLALPLIPFHAGLRIQAAPVYVQTAFAAECRIILRFVHGQEAVRHLLLHFPDDYLFFPDNQLVDRKRLADHQFMRDIHISVSTNFQCQQAFVFIMELSVGMQSICIAAAASQLFPLLPVRDIRHISVCRADLPGFRRLIPGKLGIRQRFSPEDFQSALLGHQAS